MRWPFGLTGLPAAPLSPRLKGRNAEAAPASFVVMWTSLLLTAKWTRAPRGKLSSGSAARYVFFFWLFAALLLALILDRLYETLASSGGIRSAVVCLAVAVVALVPLVPAWPYPSSPASVPSFFTSTARTLPVGTTVAVYPISDPGDASAMLWQAMSGMTFRMPGGYAVFASAPDGTASFNPAPSALSSAMISCISGVPSQISPALTRSVLRRWDARYVVVARGEFGAACATALFDRALGPHRSEGGVSVWSTRASGA